MPRATVQSIADELGVSKFAVSRALSGKSGVSDQTRRTVIETAERLGYRPRPDRRSVADILHVVIRNRTIANRELWIDVRHGIEMQSMRESFKYDVNYTDDPGEISRLAETGLGFIFIGPNERSVFEMAQATGRPVVACCHIVPPLLEIDQVSGTDEESGVLVGEYLLSLGHRDIVYVHGQQGFPGRDFRLRGLAAALTPECRLGEIAFSEDYAGTEFAPAIRRLVEAGAAPTALFCGSDGVAVTCLSEVLRLGLRVPDDVSIVGHADYPVATQISPNLTTIHMPHREIGLQAVQMIRNRVTPPKVAAHDLAMRIHLVADLVERDSTAAPGSPDWIAALSAHVGTPA